MKEKVIMGLAMLLMLLTAGMMSATLSQAEPCRAGRKYYDASVFPPPELCYCQSTNQNCSDCEEHPE